MKSTISAPFPIAKMLFFSQFGGEKSQNLNKNSQFLSQKINAKNYRIIVLLVVKLD